MYKYQLVYMSYFKVNRVYLVSIFDVARRYDLDFQVTSKRRIVTKISTH